MSSPTGYSRLQLALHWLVALFVIAAWWLGDGMGRLLRQKIEGADVGLPLHAILGLIVLGLMVIRILVRMSQGAPGAEPGVSEAEAKARSWGHGLLYVLLFGVPLGGAAAWFLNNHAIAEVHPLAANVLLILAGGHAALALWHHYGRKDGTLRRMMRPGA